MFESLRQGVDERFKSFRRDWLNVGYVDHLGRLIDAEKAQVEGPLNIGAAAIKGSTESTFRDSRPASELTDYEHILRDQMFGHSVGETTVLDSVDTRDPTTIGAE